MFRHGAWRHRAGLLTGGMVLASQLHSERRFAYALSSPPKVGEEETLPAKQHERSEFRHNTERRGLETVFTEFQSAVKEGQTIVAKAIDTIDSTTTKWMALVEAISEVVKSSDTPRAAFGKILGLAWNIDSGGTFGSNSRDIVNVFFTEFSNLKRLLDRTFGNLEVYMDPTALFYYIEHEDQRKTPSWKRRKHRFMEGIDVEMITELHDSLELSEISYWDSKQKITQGLRNIGDCWELSEYRLDSLPGEPSHFVAFRKDRSDGEEQHILIVVRGTKSVSDLLTDLNLDTEDYMGGKVHAGIVRSGQWLAKEYGDAIEVIKRDSGCSNVKVSLIGHSLGAGAAVIAAMELRKNWGFDTRAVGFGCPPLLSKDLSESCSDYVTTLVCDSDIVTRITTASVCNLLHDLAEFDWEELAARDVKAMLEELQRHNPLGFSVEEYADNIMSRIHNYVQGQITERTPDRMVPELYVPGRVVHIYRDGRGVSGTFVPCTFFKEIDVTRTMLDDHLIDGYEKLFLQLLREHMSDPYFKFEVGSQKSFLNK